MQVCIFLYADNDFFNVNLCPNVLSRIYLFIYCGSFNSVEIVLLYSVACLFILLFNSELNSRV